jgi:hypothetical protein
MTSRYPTLLLAVAVAIMTSQASPVPSQGRALLAARVLGMMVVTRFVCAHCTDTGLLSSRGLFLNQAAVRRHIAASKPCFKAAVHEAKRSGTTHNSATNSEPAQFEFTQ